MLLGVVEDQEMGLFSRSWRPDCGADGDLKSSLGCLDETASSAVSSAEVSGVSIIVHFNDGFSFRSASTSPLTLLAHLEEGKTYFRAAKYERRFFLLTHVKPVMLTY